MKRSRVSVATDRTRLKLDNIGAELEVRRHPAARRLTLRISRTRRAVIVTLPLKCRLEEADTFIDRHIDWVRERLDSLPDPIPYADGVAMPLRGEPHQVVFTGDTKTRIVARAEATEKWPEIRVPGRPDAASKRLKTWLFDEARRDLDLSVVRYGTILGVRAKRIAVRDQTSRWGSCSTTSVLSFSWRLILAPPFVLDYVAAHEVAHLREMNHGPKFWALVERAVPDYENAKKWLQVFGPDLHRYGAEQKSAAA